MKKAWLLSFCLFYFWSCQPDESPLPVPVTPPVTTPETPAFITEKGIPDGTPVNATIGAGGGSITSSDGRFTLTVPAGALTSSTNIGIQPITNKMPNGIGLAYRLTPDGQQFSKPAVLTAHYKAADLEGTAAEAMGIAYQDNRGAWKAKKNVTVNQTNKTISKEVSSLKDYSIYTNYMLTPDEATLLPGEVIELQVKVVKFIFPGPDGEDILSEGQGLAEAFLIRSWKINGQSGSLSGVNGSLSGSGATMKYTAPAVPPATSPVAVSVDMEELSGTKVTLVSNIAVTKNLWRMRVEWLRQNTCSPGAIASSVYTCSKDLIFRLDKDSKIVLTEIIDNNDVVVKDVASCNPTTYSATAKAIGLLIYGLQGQYDPKTSKLKFEVLGKWMDLPTYTLSYKDGPEVVTDESLQSFDETNKYTQIALKDQQQLNFRYDSGSGNAGFLFKLSAIN